jgi:hypothetical protein
MSKTRKNRSKKNFLKKITNAGKNAIPVVKYGLKTVGNTAKGVAVKTAPIVEKGVSKIYGTMAKGFDLGIKGVQGVTSKMSIKGRSMKRSKRRH